MNIFVGNLSYDMTDSDLRAEFETCGQVASASVIMDRATGRSKGFGFVEMPDAAQAKAAIQSLNLKEMKGRSVTVNEARPKENRGPRRDRW